MEAASSRKPPGPQLGCPSARPAGPWAGQVSEATWPRGPRVCALSQSLAAQEKGARHRSARAPGRLCSGHVGRDPGWAAPPSPTNSPPPTHRHPPPAGPAATHHMPLAGPRDEGVAALMDKQPAVDAPVALPREAPYPLAALAAVRSLRAAGRPSGGGALSCVRGRGPRGRGARHGQDPHLQGGGAAAGACLGGGASAPPMCPLPGRWHREAQVPSGGRGVGAAACAPAKTPLLGEEENPRPPVLGRGAGGQAGAGGGSGCAPCSQTKGLSLLKPAGGGGRGERPAARADEPWPAHRVGCTGTSSRGLSPTP